MTLSDPVGPGVPEPGSSRPRGRRVRKATLAAALALAAAGGLFGVTQTTGAMAATLDTVEVYVGVADVNNRGAGWGQAWDTCRRYHPSTKSVEFAGSQAGSSIAVQYWACLDTP
jgi:hypothetical protein